MIINQLNHLDMRIYPTNLTENQWQVITKICPDNRKRKHNMKEIFNAIFYLLKTGCQWRMLPTDFAPWNTVYYYEPEFDISKNLKKSKLAVVC
jgi:transposase